jgi:hypothetical protein
MPIPYCKLCNFGFRRRHAKGDHLDLDILGRRDCVEEIVTCRYPLKRCSTPPAMLLLVQYTLASVPLPWQPVFVPGECRLIYGLAAVDGAPPQSW